MSKLINLTGLTRFWTKAKDYIDTALNGKVDKVTGKGLSTNDLTATLKGNYDAAYTHSNNSDVHVTAAQKTAWDGKADGDHNHNGTYAAASHSHAYADLTGKPVGAFNIRKDSGCEARQSTEHIQIDSKKDLPGLDIHIQPGTKGETVSIPACVTHGGVDDLVYNDFFVGEGADVTIVAGCGVHTDSGEQARHNGIHRFFLEKGARVTYLEKHVGTGKGEGVRSIDPVTEMFLEEDAVMTMDTSQIGGVDKSVRKTSATLAAGAKLHIHAT